MQQRTFQTIKGARARNATLKELDRDGIHADSPIRSLFEHTMADNVLVVRSPNGKIAGAIQYDLYNREVKVIDVRMMDQGFGAGTQAFIELARIAQSKRYGLKVYGALESAKRFYTSVGATFRTGSNIGAWTKESRDALANGAPVRGAILPYEEWVKLDLP